jgi:hypothetical protein
LGVSQSLLHLGTFLAKKIPVWGWGRWFGVSEIIEIPAIEIATTQTMSAYADK